MKPEFEYSKVSNSEEIQQFGTILEQCFLSISGEEQAWLKRMGVDNLRIIRHNAEIVGGLVMIPMGQWWGGVQV